MGVSVTSCSYAYMVNHVTVYNEKKRLRERERVFDVSALQRLAATAVARSFEDVLFINRIGEGAANRAFVINFRDGFRLVARIPYPVIQPVELVVASEAATMAFLRSKGIPVPQVYGYSATAENPAGTEYVFMEFSPGKQLDTVWSHMGEQNRLRFVKSLVDLEARLFDTSFSASGSLYFHRDVPATAQKLAVHSADVNQSDSLYIGPSTSLDLWYGRRSELNVERGPRKSIAV
jgi:aminoglycoside phosphotransferase (APT) family kinase protein